jgi:hypothetical protein
MRMRARAPALPASSPSSVAELLATNEGGIIKLKLEALTQPVTVSRKIDAEAPRCEDQPWYLRQQGGIFCGASRTRNAVRSWPHWQPFKPPPLPNCHRG